MIRILIALCALLGSLATAQAQGLTTITVLDSASATKTYAVVQNASNQFSSTTVICDNGSGSGATTCANVANNALDVNVVSATGVAQSSATSGQTISPIGIAVVTSAPSYTNGNTNLPSATIRGGVWTNLDTWAGTALGTPAAFGTSPGAVVAGSVNAAQFIGTTAVASDPCKTGTKVITPINVTTNTTTRIPAAASGASNKRYICAISLQTDAANDIGIVEGTGGTCGTGTAGVYGGTTSGAGLNLQQGQGIAWGNGESYVMATAGTNVDFCLITSVATNVSGHMISVTSP